MKNVADTTFFGSIIVGFIAFIVSKAAPALSVAAGTIIILSALAMFVSFMFLLKQQQKKEQQAREEISDTDAQLHRELIETHMLALSELKSADHELKTTVIKLLVEAGKHQGEPSTGRFVYGADYFIDWNRKGLALVAQARELVEEFAARPTYRELASKVLRQAASAVNPGTEVNLTNQYISTQFVTEGTRLPRWVRLDGEIHMSATAPTCIPAVPQDAAVDSLAAELQSFAGSSPYPDRDKEGFVWAVTALLNVGGDAKARAHITISGTVAVFGPMC
jgi:hypothetical protein